MAKAAVARKVVAPVVREEPAVDETERQLGRWVARGLPAATVVIAVGVAVASSVGPALLILAAGALLGSIGFVWASLRTLSGDAPLPEGFEALGADAPTDLAARKTIVLRALKDLELEHSVGKIDDDDYAQIAAPYRDEAKAILRQMDVDVEPLRAKAEEIARKYLEKEGLADAPVDDAPPARDEEAEVDADARPECPKCSTRNDVDAAFCKKCGTALSSSPAEEHEPDASS